jgi:hypothetical protein
MVPAQKTFSENFFVPVPAKGRAPARGETALGTVP